MKIIYLIAGTYRPAGMERVLSLKAHWLAEHMNAEVVIVTTDQRGREPVFGLGDFRQIDLGIDYEQTNGASFAKKTLNYVIKHNRHRKLLTALLLKEKADVVVSMFNNDADFVPGIADGSKKVLEVHFSRFKKLQYGRKGLWAVADKLRTRADVRAAARFDTFVTLTEEDRGYWEKDYAKAGLKSNIISIPNPGTFSEEAPAGKEYDISSRTVLAVGRYTAQKGFDMLLDAWKTVKANPVADGWNLRIAGDGECREALESQAAASGLGDSVLFGPSDDMRSLYAASSFLVLSSRYEGLPMVLLEAQAMSLPVVAYRCKCGPVDVINDSIDGILVKDQDVNALASSLLLMIADPLMRQEMSTAAVKNARRFDISVIMPRWKELFLS